MSAVHTHAVYQCLCVLVCVMAGQGRAEQGPVAMVLSAFRPSLCVHSAGPGGLGSGLSH